VSAFEHVTALLSFVYALALTHLLARIAELIVARERIKFSGLLALGMVALRHFAPAAMHLIFVLFAFPPSMFFIGCAFLSSPTYHTLVLDARLCLMLETLV